MRDEGAKIKGEESKKGGEQREESVSCEKQKNKPRRTKTLTNQVQRRQLATGVRRLCTSEPGAPPLSGDVES